MPTASQLSLVAGNSRRTLLDFCTKATCVLLQFYTMARIALMELLYPMVAYATTSLLPRMGRLMQLVLLSSFFRSVSVSQLCFLYSATRLPPPDALFSSKAPGSSCCCRPAFAAFVGFATSPLLRPACLPPVLWEGFVIYLSWAETPPLRLPPLPSPTRPPCRLGIEGREGLEQGP